MAHLPSSLPRRQRHMAHWRQGQPEWRRGPRRQGCRGVAKRSEGPCQRPPTRQGYHRGGSVSGRDHLAIGSEYPPRLGRIPDGPGNYHASLALSSSRPARRTYAHKHERPTFHSMQSADTPLAGDARTRACEGSRRQMYWTLFVVVQATASPRSAVTCCTVPSGQRN